MNDRPIGTVSTIQKMLRKVANYNPNVIAVVPDGLYGKETRDSVASFQRAYSLPVTGEVDNDTWDRLSEVYSEILRLNELDICVRIFGEDGMPITPGEAHVSLYVIQAMMLALSEQFSNLGKVYVTGIYDEATADAVEKIQIVSGITPTDSIDREFVNALNSLYGTYITSNRVENLAKPTVG